MLDRPHSRHRIRSLPVLLTALALVLAACGGAVVAADEETATTTTTAGSGAVAVMDASAVHEISVDFDVADYEAMLATYSSTGEKEWIVATVTIDGVVYEQAGIRLKGNSSLRGLAGGAGPGGSDVSVDTPESLPWLIRLDKFVDGQHHQGITDLVVRSNTSETSLNEAVALDLLELAGLASQDAVMTGFSVNGSDPTLRLVVELPDDVWMEDTFGTNGALYKAESTGDYSYRGDDPAAYDEVFDQEAGSGDLTPLIEFLDFINNADDETFYAELGDRLDVEAFATYLAMQDLIDNFDDIDGPGNNSYLYYDAATGMFTVVAWDHNLAFGALGDAGGFGGPPGGGELPADLPEMPGGDPVDGDVPGPPRGAFGGDAAGAPAGGGPGAGSNILVERFLADPGYEVLYEEKLAELTASLYDSGAAAGVLDSWVDVLGTTDLVDAATVTSEADAISAYF